MTRSKVIQKYKFTNDLCELFHFFSIITMFAGSIVFPIGKKKLLRNLDRICEAVNVDDIFQSFYRGSIDYVPSKCT